ncbi:class I SAM-dependent methyltransferase [Rhizobium puerariae]|uniref:Class I SAM-dependent methyltransferase n=1 Tax=Rhizobium puerariae TaxID=1585791 RepID=A0ABV6AC65_9HYPH
MNSALRKFIFHDLQMIEGYIDPPDSLVFLSLLQAQQRNGLEGGIAEIGVFYGRSYFLLRKISEGSSARVLGIDLFDIGRTTDGAAPQYNRFIDNGRRLGLAVEEDLIITGDTARLKAEDIVGKVGRTRFFSIDGGHMLHHVVTDAALATDTLADHGIIAFDDTFNPAWPEVTVGVSDFLRQKEGAFSAFCMTKYKTYVCRTGFHAFYEKVIAEAKDLLAFDHVKTEFLGSNVARLHNPMSRRMVYELMVRSGMSAFSERVYR